MDLAIGVYGLCPLGHHFNFWFPKFSIQSVELAIHVADTNIIKIDECQRADARASQRFDCPRTHPTQTDNADVCVPDSVRTRRSEEAANTAKACCILIHDPRLEKTQAKFNRKAVRGCYCQPCSGRIVVRGKS